MGINNSPKKIKSEKKVNRIDHFVFINYVKATLLFEAIIIFHNSITIIIKQ